MEAVYPFFAAVVGGVLIVLHLTGAIWFVVAAFRRSALWGLGVLFVPFVPVVFLVKHWGDARRPFLLSLAPVLVAICAFWAMPGLLLLNEDTEEVTTPPPMDSMPTPTTVPEPLAPAGPRAISSYSGPGDPTARFCHEERDLPLL